MVNAITFVIVCAILINTKTYSALSYEGHSGSCKLHEFKCDNGQCINDELLCDGKVDCGDASDETSKACSELACPVYAFRCKYGACVHRNHRCNGIRNCFDNSDEDQCANRDKTNSYKPQSPAWIGRKKFTCLSGEIINEELICDGQTDCIDHSDETEILCSNFYCPYFTFRCNYGACISLTKKCNGVNNCADGSDEAICSNQKPDIPIITEKPIIVKAFKCDSGDVINEELLCDGEPQCADKSDETSKECSKFHCPSFTYKCDYGACVLAGAKCNGIKECADNSDETFCIGTSYTHRLQTRKFKCNSGQVINIDEVCDGKADCADHSDETLSICSQINCPKFTYRCNYGACVHGTAKCNGFRECFDNSDEAECSIKNNSSIKVNQQREDQLIFT